MEIASLSFLLLAFVLLCFASPLPGPWKRLSVLAASGVMLGASFDLRSGAVLATIVLLGYGATRLACAKRWTGHASACALLLLFLVLKGYEWIYVLALVPCALSVLWLRRTIGSFGLLAGVILAVAAAFARPTLLVERIPWAREHGILVLGFSYVLFRQIQLLVDAAQGQVERLGFVSYVAFLLAFWTFLSGPIQSHDDFLASWEKLGNEPVDGARARASLDRIATGYVKLVLVGPILLELAGPTRFQSFGREIAAFYAYPAFVYANFSGYCDVVIALAAALGFELPENFDRPWLARNLFDFWNRWHRTLTAWLRSYVFTPLAFLCLQRFPRWPIGTAAFSYLVTFFLMGVWHGSSLSFAIFGLLHALGAAATKVHDERLRRRLGREGFASYRERRLVRVAATLATWHFVALTFVFFRRDTPELRELAQAIGLLPGGAS